MLLVSILASSSVSIWFPSQQSIEGSFLLFLSLWSDTHASKFTFELQLLSISLHEDMRLSISFASGFHFDRLRSMHILMAVLSHNRTLGFLEDLFCCFCFCLHLDLINLLRMLKSDDFLLPFCDGGNGSVDAAFAILSPLIDCCENDDCDCDFCWYSCCCSRFS